MEEREKASIRNWWDYMIDRGPAYHICRRGRGHEIGYITSRQLLSDSRQIPGHGLCSGGLQSDLYQGYR